MQFYGLLALVFVLLVAIFAVQNAVPVDIHFLVWQFPQVSLVIVIFTSALAGALIMVFLGVVRHLKTLGKQAKGKLPQPGSSSAAQAGEEDLGHKGL
ncbi:MAG: LapA family protein [Moorellaceae bacterium]